ncbi:MAG: hypothetical protein K2H86_06050 [Muribaculaceae bacterium]|nr:hypothetical protein [Muribaculaceae bacterium]
MSRPLKWGIPGIRFIAVMRCDTLPADVAKVSESGGVVRLYSMLRDIALVPPTKMDITETHGRNGAEYAVKLRILTTDRLSYAFPLAFYVEDNNGSGTLIGARESPYPRISVQDSTSEVTGQKVLEYTVTSVLPPVEAQLMVRRYG